MMARIVNLGGLLAASAQAWADKLKSTKNCGMAHSGGPEGENLYWASAWSNGPAQSISPAQVLNAWGSEKANYSHANNNCAAGKVCGHYTQVVWKNTSSVGCGMAVCESPKNQVWVCQYLPAGNYVGQKPY
jgi:pathogenesis-related protein 1